MENVTKQERPWFVDTRKTYVPLGVAVGLIGMCWWVIGQIQGIKAELREEIVAAIREHKQEPHPINAELYVPKETGNFLEQSQQEIKRELRELRQRQDEMMQVVVEIRTELSGLKQRLNVGQGGSELGSRRERSGSDWQRSSRQQVWGYEGDEQ
jgi:hypothetical protein